MNPTDNHRPSAPSPSGPGLPPAPLAAPAGSLAHGMLAHGLRRVLSDDLAPLPRRLLEMLAASG
ncbi:MAG: hypothetical protein ACKOKG_12240, partial [Verrucomicrobiota bacterium]